MELVRQLCQLNTRRSIMVLVLAACYPMMACAAEPAAIDVAAEGAEALAAAEAAPMTDSGKVLVTARRQNYRSISATGATKTDTLLKDLPQSVRVLTADLLKDVGVNDLAGALDLSSGISRASNFGGQWDSYAMRGFTGDPNYGSDYMVNGFVSSRGYNGLRDGISTQSVEVLKGPASALYGRGEPGGTVNITTKKPRFDPNYAVEFSAGSFDTYRSAVDLTGPLSENIAYRISASYTDGKSFRDTLYVKRQFVSPSFIWLLGENTTLSYEVEALEQRAPFDRGVLAIGGKLGLIPNSRFLGEPADGPTVIKSLGHQVFVQHQLNSDWSLQSGLSYRESSLDGFSSQANLNVATNLTDGRTLRRDRRHDDYEATDISGRIELLGKFNTGAIRHNVLVGIDAYKFDDHRMLFRRNPSATNPYAIDVYNPVYGAVVADPLLPVFDRQFDQRAHGFYIQDQLDLTAKWKALLGLRHDKADQVTGNNILRTSTQQKPSANSPRLGLVYQPTKEISVYATAAKGFRPNSGLSIENTSFAPEKSKSYEIGTKLETATLTGTVAIYKITKTNVLTTNPINPFFAITAGELGSKGLEVDLSGEIYRGVKLSASYAYTDATVTKGDRLIITGSRFPNVPKHSASIVLSPTFKLGSGTASLGGGLNYVGDRLGDVATSSSFTLPAYTTARLLSSYTPNKHWRFAVNVDNLFNKQYFASSYSPLWVQPGIDRTITGNVRYTF